MIQLKNKIFLSIVFVSLFIVSCVQDNLDPDNAPGVGDVTDLTPPEADFSFDQDVVDFTVFFFTNESNSSTKQIWTIPSDAILIGDGATLNDTDITVKFSGEGEFEVGLIAQDDVPTSSEMLVQIVEVIEPLIPVIPVPEILSAGFEISTEIPEPRNAWGRSNSEAIQPISGLNIYGTSTATVAEGEIGTGRVRTGSKSAKFENNGSVRQAYQEIQVTPGASYVLQAYIKQGSDPIATTDDEEFRLAVLGTTGFSSYDATAFEDAIIAESRATPGDGWSLILLLFEVDSDTDRVAIYMDSKATMQVQVDDVEISVN